MLPLSNGKLGFTMVLAPIMVTVYHRPDLFKKCVESLQNNVLAAESELFVISDAASIPEHEPLVQQVRDYAKSINGFKKVHLHFRERNYGGHESVKKAFVDLFECYDRLIFLEDDIVVSPDFLDYVNGGLEYYADNKRIFSIAGYKRHFRVPCAYKHDIFFLENFSPWGFGFWRDRYLSVDISDFDRYSALARSKRFDWLKEKEPLFVSLLKQDSLGKLRAFDVRFEYHIHLNRLLSVFPVVSRTVNIGFDNRGEHCGDGCGSGFYQAPLSRQKRSVEWAAPLQIEKQIEERFFSAAKPSLPVRFCRSLRSYGLNASLKYYVKRFLLRLNRLPKA